jgi:hypothetical protein
MNLIWIVLLIAWLVSPVPLLILFLVQLSGKNKLKKENLKLKDEISTLLNKKYETLANGGNLHDKNVSETEISDKNTEEMIANEETGNIFPAEEKNISENSANEFAKIEISDNISDNNYIKTEGKRKISSINILLILGAAFIIIAGLIFATTAWGVLSNGIRAVVIFSFSAVFFLCSSLAERKLGLKKTGILFYTLGSVFLPITLIAAGYFEVFGNWFSLFGDGRFLLLGVTFAALSAVCLKGSADYKSPVFAWANLIGSSAAVCFFIRQITDKTDIFAVIASVYGLAVIFLAEILRKRQSERFSAVIDALPTFAAVNTVLLSISAIICAADNTRGALALVSCVIFAMGYVALSFIGTPFADKKGGGAFSAIPFVIFILLGAVRAFPPGDMGSAARVFAAVLAVPVLLSMLDVLPPRLKGAFRIVSGVFSSCLLAFCAAAALVSEPSVITTVSYGVLAAEILALGIFHKNEKTGKVMMSAFPISCVVTFTSAVRLIFDGKSDDVFYSAFTLIAVILALQALFVFVKKLEKLNIRTAASDCIFSASAAISGIVMLSEIPYADIFRESYTWYTDAVSSVSQISHVKSLCLLAILGIVLCTAVMVLPVAFGGKSRHRTVLAFAAMVFAGNAALPLEWLLSLSSRFFGAPDSETAIIFAEMIVAAVLSAVSLCLMFFGKEEKLDRYVAVALRIVVGAYAFTRLDGGTVFPLLLLLGAVSLVRFLRLKSNTELAAAILLFSVGAGYMTSELIDTAEYEEALLVTAGVSAVINAAVLFFGERLEGDDAGHVHSHAKVAERTSRYCLYVAMTVALLLLVYQINFDAAYISAAAVLFLYMAVSFYCSYVTAPLILPFALFFGAVYNQTEHFFISSVRYYSYGSGGYFPDFNAINMTILAFIVISIVLSYVLHRNALWERKEGKFYIDPFIFARVVGICCYYSGCSFYYRNARWCLILIVTACLLSLFRRGQSQKAKRIIVTVSAFGGVLAFWVQPFAKIPEVISLEMKILPVLLYLFAIRFVWKDNTKTLDKITFIAYIVSYALLFFDTAASHNPKAADGIIIMTSALAILIFSFCVKKKKWFVLAVTVLCVTVLFMTRSFWTSLGWWAYLLAVGVLLICIGAANELKKQSADKQGGIKEKLTRFMSEWKW